MTKKLAKQRNEVNFSNNLTRRIEIDLEIFNAFYEFIVAVIARNVRNNNQDKQYQF